MWREDVDDWACCALLEGHRGTVWWVEFEGRERTGAFKGSEGLGEEQKKLLEGREKAGPRLVTCSDDMTIRIWSRNPKDKPPAEPTGQGKMPSIWKNKDFEEEWVEEVQLPQVHERAVYAVSWSRKTGRIVSTGSDGKIVVYEERWRGGESSNGDLTMRDATPAPEDQAKPASNSLTEWIVVAETENAHDVFEVNHAIWATRADKGKRADDEEVVVTTGDDGEVKVWKLDI